MSLYRIIQKIQSKKFKIQKAENYHYLPNCEPIKISVEDLKWEDIDFLPCEKQKDAEDWLENLKKDQEDYKRIWEAKHAFTVISETEF